MKTKIIIGLLILFLGCSSIQYKWVPEKKMTAKDYNSVISIHEGNENLPTRLGSNYLQSPDVWYLIQIN